MLLQDRITLLRDKMSADTKGTVQLRIVTTPAQRDALNRAARIQGTTAQRLAREALERVTGVDSNSAFRVRHSPPNQSYRNGKGSEKEEAKL